MCFLFFGELRLLSPETALRLRYGQAFQGPCQDQISFGRVVDGEADAQLGLAAREFINDVLRVADRARRSSLVLTRVSPARQAASASLSPGRARVGTGQALVGEGLLRRHPQSGQGILLDTRVRSADRSWS